VASGLRQAVGDRPDHREVMAEAQVAGADSDVLGLRRRLVHAGPPREDAVQR